VQAKSAEPTDVVTVADRAAESAAVAVLSAERPGDAIFGEEGTDRPGESGRRWVVDAVDGTLNFSLGIPGWCSAVVLTDEGGPLAAAVFDPERGELFSAVRGGGARCDGRALRVREPVALGEAAVAAQWGFGKLGGAGVPEVVHGLVERVGALRIMGSGSLELAWVAAGRLHGWIQPDPAEWDWLPGALLVAEAGGEAVEAEGPAGGRWALAGSAQTVAALRELLLT
jgi:myo-inositol-1(or 4)-monophosphatase